MILEDSAASWLLPAVAVIVVICVAVRVTLDYFFERKARYMRSLMSNMKESEENDGKR